MDHVRRAISREQLSDDIVDGMITQVKRKANSPHFQQKMKEYKHDLNKLIHDEVMKKVNNEIKAIDLRTRADALYASGHADQIFGSVTDSSSKIVERAHDSIINRRETFDGSSFALKDRAYKGVEPFIRDPKYFLDIMHALDLVGAGKSIKHLQPAIQKVALGYFKEGMKQSIKVMGGDPDKVEFVLASEILERGDYWRTIIDISKNVTLARMMRSITIMGRQMGEDRKSVV